MLQKIRPYAKAAVAVAGFVVVVGNEVVSGHFDLIALRDAAIALATALGVYGVTNKA